MYRKTLRMVDLLRPRLYSLTGRIRFVVLFPDCMDEESVINSNTPSEMIIEVEKENSHGDYDGVNRSAYLKIIELLCFALLSINIRTRRRFFAFD